jgi:hypothetical protein
MQCVDFQIIQIKKECCVSGDAILYRLCTENKITPLEYQQYRNFKDQQRKQEHLIRIKISLIIQHTGFV